MKELRIEFAGPHADRISILVGAARKPPVWLQTGGIVEVDIGPIDCLRNTVCDE